MLSIKKPENREVIRDILERGMGGDFWKLIVQELEDTKRVLQRIRDSEKLSELPADQYKLRSELLKSKIKYLDILIDTPKDLASWLQNPDNKKPILDPYD